MDSLFMLTGICVLAVNICAFCRRRMLYTHAVYSSLFFTNAYCIRATCLYPWFCCWIVGH